MVQPIHEQSFLVQGRNLHLHDLAVLQAAAVDHQAIQGLSALDKDIGQAFPPRV